MAQNGANNGGALTPRQERAVLALLSESRVEAAARAASVGRTTLLRWRKLPAFRAALADAQQQAFSDATRRLAAAAVQAAETLCRNLVCGMPPVEIAAARSILEHARHSVENETLWERLAAIEQRLDAAEVSNDGRKPTDH